MGSNVLPRVVVFPFGWRIKVKQVSETEMKSLQKVQCPVCEHEDSVVDGELDGLWDQGSKTIYLLRSLKITRKRYMFIHELDHAFNEWRHEMQDEGKAKN